MASDPLRIYRRLEASHAPRRAAWLAAAFGVATVAGCQWLIPRLPAQVIDLMRVGFRLPDLPAVVLFNDYTGVYFISLFPGLVGLLGVVVVPREERRLELLLCKPVPAAQLLAARTWPVLTGTAAVGLATSLACAASAWSLGGGGASVHPAGALGAGLVMTALVVLELAALGVVFVRMRDSMNAVLIALLVALAPLVPTATFLYRPDLFVGSEGLTSALVLGSLVWYGDALAWLGPAALVVALGAASLLVRAGGRRLAGAAV